MAKGVHRGLVVLSLILLLIAEECSLTLVQPCDNPVYCYGELLEDVQTSQMFEDSKTFVDMPMKAEPSVILSDYNNLTNKSLDSLRKFVLKWFEPQASDLVPWEPTDWQERPNFVDAITNVNYQQWALDLNRLWKGFGKQVTSDVTKYPSQHSLLPVQYPFISPGGRFTEFYYWDSYWIIKGLLICGMKNTTIGMIRNLASLVNEYGLVPNGGRIYYTRRSQPPLLTWMVSVYYEFTNDSSILSELLPVLDKEYEFWMTNRTVYVPRCNCTANRYASPVTAPRPESYREDLMTSLGVPNDKREELFSNIASGAESGWDFSSRWLTSLDLSSIRTKSVIPVDLNAILGINELLLQRLHQINGNLATAETYSTAWMERQYFFDKLFWNEENKLYMDWLLDNEKHLPGYYASSLVPLYMYTINKTLNVTRSKQIVNNLKSLGVFDCVGGLPTSLNKSGQQWDFPNAWAPLQWFLVKSFETSNDEELRNVAVSVMSKWLESTYDAWVKYNQSMFEKYNCSELGSPGSGGEYILQTGFGWTNGVNLDFINSYNNQEVSGSLPYLWLLFLVPLSVIVLFVALVCICICRAVYVNGKSTYWARIRNEQLMHSSLTSSSNSDPVSPTVYANQNTIDSINDGENTYYNFDV